MLFTYFFSGPYLGGNWARTMGSDRMRCLRFLKIITYPPVNLRYLGGCWIICIVERSMEILTLVWLFFGILENSFGSWNIQKFIWLPSFFSHTCHNRTLSFSTAEVEIEHRGNGMFHTVQVYDDKKPHRYCAQLPWPLLRTLPWKKISLAGGPSCSSCASWWILLLFFCQVWHSHSWFGWWLILN
jgi:hypothetical protein